MAADTVKISYLRMEPASNGVIISYDETKKNPNSKDTYSNSFCESKKEVYDIDTTDDAALQEAFNRFQELWKKAYLDK